MRLQLVPSIETQRVSPQDILDYNTFTEKHREPKDVNELRQFERFHAARNLISRDMDTYLDASLSPDNLATLMRVDVCGLKDGSLTAVFCQTNGLDDLLSRSVDIISKSQNANVVILLPRELDQLEFRGPVRNALDNGKATLEILGWFDDTFEDTFQQTLHLIELLGNETRMRMLAPLLEKSGAKKDYRTKINPKLVYHNITAMSEAGLLSENQEGSYELSPFGRTVLAEFITFLEKTRRTMDESRTRR